MKITPETIEVMIPTAPKMEKQSATRVIITTRKTPTLALPNGESSNAKPRLIGDAKR
jgi:hypothetical protein